MLADKEDNLDHGLYRLTRFADPQPSATSAFTRTASDETTRRRLQSFPRMRELLVSQFRASSSHRSRPVRSLRMISRPPICLSFMTSNAGEGCGFLLVLMACLLWFGYRLVRIRFFTSEQHDRRGCLLRATLARHSTLALTMDVIVFTGESLVHYTVPLDPFCTQNSSR